MSDPLKQRKNQLGVYCYLLTVSYEQASGGFLTGGATTQISVERDEPATLADLQRIAKEKSRNYRLPVITWGSHTLYRWTRD